MLLDIKIFIRVILGGASITNKTSRTRKREPIGGIASAIASASSLTASALASSNSRASSAFALVSGFMSSRRLEAGGSSHKDDSTTEPTPTGNGTSVGVFRRRRRSVRGSVVAAAVKRMTTTPSTTMPTTTTMTRRMKFGPVSVGGGGKDDCRRRIPSTPEKGTLSCPEENLKIGSECRFRCDDGFAANVDKVTCRRRAGDEEEDRSSSSSSSFFTFNPPEPTWTPSTRLECADVDECVDDDELVVGVGKNTLCNPTGTEGFRCVNTIGSFVCECQRPGAKRIDGKCVVVDEEEDDDDRTFEEATLLRGSVRATNLVFDGALEDENSADYKDLAESMKRLIGDMLRFSIRNNQRPSSSSSSSSRERERRTFDVVIDGFRPGSVVVDYRITYRLTASPSPEIETNDDANDDVNNNNNNNDNYNNELVFLNAEILKSSFQSFIVEKENPFGFRSEDFFFLSDDDKEKGPCSTFGGNDCHPHAVCVPEIGSTTGFGCRCDEGFEDVEPVGSPRAGRHCRKQQQQQLTKKQKIAILGSILILVVLCVFFLIVIRHNVARRRKRNLMVYLNYNFEEE